MWSHSVHHHHRRRLLLAAGRVKDKMCTQEAFHRGEQQALQTDKSKEEADKMVLSRAGAPLQRVGLLTGTKAPIQRMGLARTEALQRTAPLKERGRNRPR